MPEAAIEVFASADVELEVPAELTEYARQLNDAAPRVAEKSGTLESNRESLREAMTAKMAAVTHPASASVSWQMFHYVAGPRPDQWFEIGANGDQSTDSIYTAKDSNGAPGYLIVRYAR